MDQNGLKVDSILSFLKQEKELLYKSFGVVEIGIFGSFANGNNNNESDIDIAVKFSQVSFDNYMNLKNYLEENFHKQVDLYRLRNIQSPFQKRIESKIIYA